MKAKLLFAPLGALLLGACSMVGNDDVSTTPDRASPPPASAPEAKAQSSDAALQFPILFDYRQVLAAQDISGLPEGTQSFELDFYAPRRVGWTPAAERLVQEGIRVIHVDDQRAARTRISLGPDDGTGARRVKVEMELPWTGAYVVMIGANGLAPAHADPELLAQYAVRDPGTLKPHGDYEFLHPGLMLRTVGHCNHVREVVTKVDATGTLRTLELRFSEPLDARAMASGVNLSLTDTEGRRGGGARADEVRVQDDVIELKIPAMRGQTGTLDIPLTQIRNLAGRFREDLSCAQADGSVGVGYLFGAQDDGDHIVAPLQEAAARALGEDRKSP